MTTARSNINGQQGDFAHLTPDEQEILSAYRLGREILAKQPTEAAPTERTISPERLALYARFKQLAPDEQEQFLGELRKETESAPTEALEPAENEQFECVNTIARHVLAQLMQGDYGATIFDIQNGFDTLTNFYFDIVDGIERGLPRTELEDYRKAAFELSVR